MAVSSILHMDPSLHNHGHLSTTPVTINSVRSGKNIHRDEPTLAHARYANPENERASPILFCIAPENDARRFELYEALEQIYSAVWSGRNRVSHYILHSDQRTKRWLYQTIFEVLNHRSVVEEVLNESGFYAKNFELHSHEALVHVITYDFLRTKFAIRPPSSDCSDKIPPLVVRVADALRKHMVKLNATVARMRIKADARSLTELLPVDAQEKYVCALHHPHYARVNVVKVSNISSEVIAKLIADEFSPVHSLSQVSSTPLAFCHGSKDLVAFSPDCRGKMDDHPLVRSGQLILQDGSSYRLVERLTPILEACPVPVHVILTSPGVEALHIASLLKDRGTVLVYGLSSVTSDLFQQKATILGVSNIQLIQTTFSALLPTGSEAHTISLILCMPPSSLSTVINPVDFILQGGHLLPSLFSAPKEATAYCAEQTEMLAHALEFVEAHYVAYATRSVYPAENESIIRRVLETHDTHQHRYVPPTSQDQDEGLHCYLAVLEKVPAKPLPTPSEVIARAIAGGILSGEGLSHMEKKKKKKKGKKVFSSSEGIPMTIAAQKKVVQKKPPEVPIRKPFRH